MHKYATQIQMVGIIGMEPIIIKDHVCLANLIIQLFNNLIRLPQQIKLQPQIRLIHKLPLIRLPLIRQPQIRLPLIRQLQIRLQLISLTSQIKLQVQIKIRPPIIRQQQLIKILPIRQLIKVPIKPQQQQIKLLPQLQQQLQQRLLSQQIVSRLVSFQ
jgi:hypothetical protein